MIILMNIDTERVKYNLSHNKAVLKLAFVFALSLTNQGVVYKFEFFLERKTQIVDESVTIICCKLQRH